MLESKYQTNFRENFERKIAKLNRILEASAKVLHYEGIHGMTFSAVGKECEMTPAHVNYYFKNKQHLTQATIHYVMEKSRDYFRKEMGTRSSNCSRLEQMVSANFKWLKKHPIYRTVDVTFECLAATDLDLAKVYLQHKESGAKWMAELAAEYMRTPIDFELGLILHNLVSGYLQHYCASLAAKQKSTQDLEKAAIAACKQLLLQKQLRRDLS